MRTTVKRTIITLLTLLFLVTMNSVYVKQVSAADEYDTLRDKWKEMLTGGTAYNPLDPDIAAQITALTATASANWSNMDNTPGTYLWSDLASTTNSSQITSTYGRLKSMALAYATTGSTLQNDATLLADILTGLDWMNTNRYNASSTPTNPSNTKYDNWWDWEIGAPLALNDIVVLLYGQLSATQITNNMNAIDHFQPTVTMTGANRTWECTIIGVRGIIVKNATKIANARDGLSTVFNYVTNGDGFYADGSFIQHEKHPYTGGYGTGLLQDIANLMYVLNGSTWAVTDVDKHNVYKWVHDSFEPLIYKGAMMDLTRGRNISRSYAQDQDAAISVIKAIIRISQSAPTTDEAAFRSMVKYWIDTNTYKNFYTYVPTNMIVLGKEIAANATSRGELIANKQFPNMARTVHLRPGFGLGISMSSNRIYNFEAINSENLKGWYTGDGMTYLYNHDLSQFSNDFWPTVNKYRLPGVTVDTMTRTNSSGSSYLSSKDWVGGTSILGTYGTTGMELVAWNSNLTAKKSWFMFDDEVVALGAGITNTGQTGNGWDGTARKVETIAENRKLNSSGNNALTVNGAAKSTALGWSETMTGVNWAHLAGSVSGSDIGYYFPGGTTLNGKREARTGKWSDLDGRAGTSTTNITSNYMTMWFDHGVNPTDSTYSYVMLPGKTSTQVSSYASSPNATELENSTSVQAVKETALNVVGMNFWGDALKWVQVSGTNFLSSDKKASIMTKENAGSDIELAVSDPTQANTGSINIEINRSATGYLSYDSGVTITQLSPTIKLSVNVNAAKGKTFKVKLSYTGGTPITPSDIIIDNTSAEFTGTWLSSTVLPNYYGSDYVYNNSGTGADKVRWRPTIPTTGNYQVYYRIPDGNSGRSTNAPFTVYYNGGSQLYTVNEQTVPGGAWVMLGTYNFAAGTTGYVELTDNANGTYVNADAMKFSPVSLTNLSPSATLSVDSTNGAFTKELAVDGIKNVQSSRWLSTNTAEPHWFQLDWPSSKTISNVKIWSGSTSGPDWQIDTYKMQYWSGSSWVDIPGASVTGNTKDGMSGQYNDLSFAAVTTTKIRMYITDATTVGSNKDARLFEIEVWGM
ncbi:polysaccharide lyase family 8 super-sandwich domain-containing protein [Paenibacillus qinlingensis]|uniref:Hyaluronate lyase n=1 Tax=Paenibacillus qinlingensis TaxID=1837343 RepID=A0ABU1NUW0_9BACL|nr:polysaccharide lyase family 8 super-sandwich domain-containing protein [Paenibacillus qinlingensis]MDR6550787.1 hyaluronate lyase [Paenibacillus qinlingensis]